MGFNLEEIRNRSQAQLNKVANKIELKERIDTDNIGVSKFYTHQIEKSKGNCFRWNNNDLNRIAKEVVGTCLDIGCGPGYVLEHLASKGVIVEGCDICPEMVALAKSRGLNILEQDAENLSTNYKENQFDTVICLGTLEHILNMEKALKEMHKVASKKLIVTVPIYREGISIHYDYETIPNIERWLERDDWEKRLNIFDSHCIFSMWNRDLMAIYIK